MVLPKKKNRQPRVVAHVEMKNLWYFLNSHLLKERRWEEKKFSAVFYSDQEPVISPYHGVLFTNKSSISVDYGGPAFEASVPRGLILLHEL